MCTLARRARPPYRPLDDDARGGRTGLCDVRSAYAIERMHGRRRLRFALIWLVVTLGVLVGTVLRPLL